MDYCKWLTPHPQQISIPDISVHPVNLSLPTTNSEGPNFLTAVREGSDKGSGDFHIAVLVGRLHFSGNPGFAIALVLLSNGSRASDYIIEVDHPFETHAKFAQGQRSHVV